jgi:ADP-heptose:LPS heptosyltransferase
VSSFLVIAPQGLGDALEATPIVAALKKARPQARIDVAVLRPGPRQLFAALDSVVDDVLYYPYWESGLGGFALSVLRSLARMRSYDASLLAYPAARAEYHMLARLHNAHTRLAHDYWPGRRASVLGLHNVLVPVDAAHNVQRNLDLVRALGFDVDAATSYVVPRAWIGDERHAKRVALHVGTVTHHGLANKRWPVERFGELASRLATLGFDVCVVSGPDERAESKAIVDATAGARLVEGRLDEVARFLSGCAAAVTNDSGIGHLAAAVGTEVLALHGPTPVEGGPYGSHAERFRPSPCPACFDPRLRNTECALHIDYACLKRDMPVDLVEEQVLTMLRRQAHTS